MKRLFTMYQHVQSKVQAKLGDQKGATMVEYALMVALIAVVCITAVTSIGTSADAKFDDIADAITNAALAPAPAP